GITNKLSREESEAYFKTRPRGARLGAWASRQSEVITNREALEQRFQEFEQKYPGDNIPLPSYWGGYVLGPQRIEFWQGRPNRLNPETPSGCPRSSVWSGRTAAASARRGNRVRGPATTSRATPNARRAGCSRSAK